MLFVIGLIVHAIDIASITFESLIISKFCFVWADIFHAGIYSRFSCLEVAKSVFVGDIFQVFGLTMSVITIHYIAKKLLDFIKD